TPGIADNSAVRSAHAASTVSTRRGLSSANELSCSLVKHTTSHRPLPGATGTSPASSTVSGVSSSFPENEGNRFSKTTTSYDGSGTSVGWPGALGHSGHRSAGGL